VDDREDILFQRIGKVPEVSSRPDRRHPKSLGRMISGV
jgi:hypothetical protein